MIPDLQEVGCGGMDWIDLVQGSDRFRELMNAVMNIHVPSNKMLAPDSKFLPKKKILIMIKITKV